MKKKNQPSRKRSRVLQAGISDARSKMKEQVVKSKKSYKRKRKHPENNEQ